MRLPSASSTFLCLAFASTSIWAQSTDFSELPVSQILERANAFLAQGSGAEAIKLYSLAIDRDPAAYLTLYRRATTYLSMGQNARALEDFEKVLKAADDFDQARLQIAKIHMKTGDFSKVAPPLDRYLKSHPSDATARELKTSVAMLRKHVENAVRHHKAKAWDLCISAASTVLEQAAHSKEVRELRAECWLGQGGVEEAIADYTRALVLDPTSTTLSLRLSLLSTLFLSQPSETALSSLKQCLHHDPESKPCKTLHRLLRALEKDFHKAKNFIEASQWSRASPLLTRDPADGLIKRVEALILDYSKSSPPANLGISTPVLGAGTDWAGKSAFLTTLYGWACKAHVSAGEIRTGAKYCEAVLKRDPENVDGLVGRGETLLKEENYESATRVLQDAFEKTGRQDRNVAERLQRAQRLLKQSKQKDYYKVLGVSRDADLKTIKKAFRKASLKAHPDKGGTEEKMAAVNEAYEVLGNPELRARFDNGDDPNDHAQQQNPFAHHQAGQMFQQFFFQQGGGFSGGGGPRVQFQWNN